MKCGWRMCGRRNFFCEMKKYFDSANFLHGFDTVTLNFSKVWFFIEKKSGFLGVFRAHFRKNRLKRRCPVSISRPDYIGLNPPIFAYFSVSYGISHISPKLCVTVHSAVHSVSTTLHVVSSEMSTLHSKYFFAAQKKFLIPPPLQPRSAHFIIA